MNKRLLLTLLFSAVLAACSEPAAKLAGDALQLARDTACALDGMLLADYPGPKGQIRYQDGQVDAFCDTVELIAMLKAPESTRSISGSYVQDMAKAEWKNPQGHWIDAKTAFYVAGSKLHGSMGPTFASFAQRTEAEAFARHNGGRVYGYAAISADMARLDGGVLKDGGM